MVNINIDPTKCRILQMRKSHDTLWNEACQMPGLYRIRLTDLGVRIVVGPEGLIDGHHKHANVRLRSDEE